jgi:hypothetical protein
MVGAGSAGGVVSPPVLPLPPPPPPQEAINKVLKMIGDNFLINLI